MTTARILNQAQAEAVYSAICALNNVHLRGCDLRFGNAIVQLDFNGTVRVIGTAVVDDERYADDSAFATAYGLNNDAAPAVCSECGGRGEIETGIGMMVCTSCPA